MRAGGFNEFNFANSQPVNTSLHTSYGSGELHAQDEFANCSIRGSRFCVCFGFGVVGTDSKRFENRIDNVLNGEEPIQDFPVHG